jgi:hypothetical protein
VIDGSNEVIVDDCTLMVDLCIAYEVDRASIYTASMPSSTFSTMVHAWSFMFTAGRGSFTFSWYRSIRFPDIGLNHSLTMTDGALHPDVDYMRSL